MKDEKREDTYRYHRQHGAKLYRQISASELEKLENYGWRDSPAAAEKAKRISEKRPDSRVDKPKNSKAPRKTKKG